MSRARRHVTQFTINRTGFCLGDVVVGTFDFSRAGTRCYQVSVSLDCDEAIATHMKPASSSLATTQPLPTTGRRVDDDGAALSSERRLLDALPDASAYSGGTALQHTVAEEHLCTVDTLRASVSLAIPPRAHQSFVTNHGISPRFRFFTHCRKQL